jgi:hypothetical protein
VKFTLSHARALMGNNISVAVEADEGRAIVRVRAELDGSELANDQLVSPSESYDRTFLNAGSAGPLIEHTLVLSVEQDDAKVHSSTSVWVDPS